jgi:hypothetical protein
MSEMNKAEIVAELDAMAWHRLFNCRHWKPDRETHLALDQKLIEMGLEEQVSSDTWQIAPLGKELDIDLFQAFMGLFWEWEVPLILRDHHLIDELEFDSILARMEEADPEFVLLGAVRRAYLVYRDTRDDGRYTRNSQGRSLSTNLRQLSACSASDLRRPEQSLSNSPSPQWKPKVIAEMNDYQFKVVRLQGDFVWHDHKDTDETFIVLEGEPHAASLSMMIQDNHVLDGPLWVQSAKSVEIGGNVCLAPRPDQQPT